MTTWLWPPDQTRPAAVMCPELPLWLQKPDPLTTTCPPPLACFASRSTSPDQENEGITCTLKSGPPPTAAKATTGRRMMA